MAFACMLVKTTQRSQQNSLGAKRVLILGSVVESAATEPNCTSILFWLPETGRQTSY